MTSGPRGEQPEVKKTMEAMEAMEARSASPGSSLFQVANGRLRAPPGADGRAGGEVLEPFRPDESPSGRRPTGARRPGFMTAGVGFPAAFGSGRGDFQAGLALGQMEAGDEITAAAAPCVGGQLARAG